MSLKSGWTYLFSRSHSCNKRRFLKKFSQFCNNILYTITPNVLPCFLQSSLPPHCLQSMPFVSQPHSILPLHDTSLHRHPSLLSRLFWPFNNFHKLLRLLLLSFNISFIDYAFYGRFLVAHCASFWTCCLEMKWWHSIFRVIVIIGVCMSCCCLTNKEGWCYSLHKVFD